MDWVDIIYFFNVSASSKTFGSPSNLDVKIKISARRKYL